MAESQGTSSKSNIDNKNLVKKSSLTEDNIHLDLIFAEVSSLLKEQFNKNNNDTRLVKILVKLESYCKVLKKHSENQENTLTEISEKRESIRKMDREKLDFEKNIKHLEKRLKASFEVNKKLKTSHIEELDTVKTAHVVKVQELTNHINELQIENDEMKKKAGSCHVNASNFGGTQNVNVQSVGQCTDDACKRELENTKRALEMKQAENNECKLELRNQNKALEEKITESDDWKKKYEAAIETNQNLKNQNAELNDQLNTVTHIPVDY